MRRVRLVATCLGRARRDAAGRVPRAAAARRPVPRAARLRPTGHLDGFRYIVLAEQFRGSVDSPFSNLDTTSWSISSDEPPREFGLLALLVPFGFVATAIRRPRYALLTGIALGPDGVLRRVLRQRGDRALLPRPDRSSAGPGWRSWSRPSSTSLARAAGSPTRRRPAPARSDPRRRACSRRGILLGPALIDFAHRARAADRSHDTIAQRWLDRRGRRARAERGGGELVELLDAAMVRESTSRGGSRTSTSSMIGRASTRILGAPRT